MNIAIVGRPNVGKSALFNRIAGRRITIVHGQPGITRDRISAKCQIGGKTFKLWDTGGIVGRGETQLPGEVRASAELAMKESDLILFVVDGQDGLNPMDRELARLVRKLHKPVLLLVNKIDDPKHQSRADEFSALGFENVFPLSAAHGRGIPELLEKIENFLPASEIKSQTANIKHPIAIAILGRPNAGKSSLINALLWDRRAIVSEIPGTTRDAVDVEYEREGKHYLLIDTAGIRARSKPESAKSLRDRTEQMGPGAHDTQTTADHGRRDCKRPRGIVLHRLRARLGNERADRRACGAHFQNDRTHPTGGTRAYRHRQIESRAEGGLCRKSAADGKRQTVKAVLRNSIQRKPKARVRAAGDRALCQFPSPSDPAVRPFS